MDNRTSTTLCRTCLTDDGIYPIFGENSNGEPICSKLYRCLREKIEDLAGYPRNICETCNNVIDNICNFISKYKECHQILEKSLLLVKEENIDFNDCSYNEFPELDLELNQIKLENKIDKKDSDSESAPLIKLKALRLTIKKVQIDPVKKRKHKRKFKASQKISTNKVASSILEGDFTWTGSKWCLSRNLTLHSKNCKQVKLKSNKVVNKEKPVIPKKPKEKKPPPPKLCDLCGEIFKTQEKLTVHKKKMHFKSPAKCPKCPRICSSEYYLNRHLRRKHNTGHKDYICASCGREFAFKGELSSHNKNVHEKHLKPKKVFECKICNKVYKCAKSVLVHERSVHTGQRPAVCSVCGSSFYHEDYLKEHMRLHTGETPFKCPICGRGYAQRGNMKSHLRIHRISELDPVTLSKLRPNYLKRLKIN